jgi:hypothetical protein
MRSASATPATSAEAQFPLAAIITLIVVIAGLGTAVAVRVHDRHDAERHRRQALAHRSALLRQLERQITDYARRQVKANKLGGPIVRTRCQVFQRDNPDDLALRRARYSCTAVTSETDVIYMGHLFVAVIDYTTGHVRFHRKGIPIWLGI